MNIRKVGLTLVGLIIVSVTVLSFCAPHNTPDDLESNQQKIITNIRRILEYKHFSPPVINDSFSAKVFDSYLEKIDPYKRYLLQSDITLFKDQLYKMDDYFEDADLNFFNASIDTLSHRVSFLQAHYKEILSKPFDFTKDETIGLDEDLLDYTQDKEALLERWRKILKYNVLTEIYASEKEQEEKLKNKDSAYIKRSFDEIEEASRKQVSEDYEDFFRRYLQRGKKEWFDVYVNAYTEMFDPHSNYLSPKDKEDFDFGISGRLEGIGAIIQDLKGYMTIKEIVIGSPSWKQGELSVEDKVLKVAQGNQEPVNIVGMLLDDAIRLIRGKKGTTVVLTIEKKDGTIKQIPIVRDVIEYDESYAKSAIVKTNDGVPYGLIYLPEFYSDPEDFKSRNAGADFEKELLALKSQNVKGIVIDLRGNGGGFLATAISIAGLFVEKGPIVQIKTRTENTKVYNDDDNALLQWKGNVVVLVDEFSASASEILAGALQDYNRALIMGPDQTFGKGTVQNFFPVNFMGKEDLGALKFTIQKFYRINGESTQLDGVKSDIVFPNEMNYGEISERKYSSALPHDKIKELSYKKWTSKSNFTKAIDKSQTRMAANKNFALMKESAEWINGLRNREVASLDYQKFKAFDLEQEKKQDYFDSISSIYTNKLTIASSAYELALIENDSVLREKREVWHKDLSKDIELQEAVNVLSDLNTK